jgi:hypothetical protein
MTVQAPTPEPGRPTFAAGPVTGVGSMISALEPPPPTMPDVITSGRQRPAGRALLWYGGAAGLVLVIGLVVVLVLLVGGNLGSGAGPLSSKADPPPDLRPPLARLCPPPSAPNEAPPAPAQPPTTGARTTDETAGISYAAYGAPWVAWPLLWRMGTLQVPYGVGQHFITETYFGGEYHASILSAAVPATVNDSTAIDLDCVGRQVAADVQAEYYPQPNTRDLMRDERTTLGGRPAWVTKFRLHFNEPGLKAKSELVAVALIDVGRPTAAVLYVSIPDTNPEWDHVVDEVLVSVRPT